MIKKISFLLIILMMFAACTNPVDNGGDPPAPETGGIRIVLPGAPGVSGSARAAYSEAPASYSVTVANPADSFSTTQTGAAGATIVVNSLKPATYTVTVKGLDADSVEIMEGSTSTVVVAGETADASVQLNYTAGGLNVDVILPSVDNPVVLGPQRIKKQGNNNYTYDANGYVIRIDIDPWWGMSAAYETFATDPATGRRVSSEYFVYDEAQSTYVKYADGVITHDSDGRETSFVKTYTVDSGWTGYQATSVNYDDTAGTATYTLGNASAADGSDFVIHQYCTRDSLNRLIGRTDPGSWMPSYYWFFIHSGLDTTANTTRVTEYYSDTNLMKFERFYEDNVLVLEVEYTIATAGYYTYAVVRDADGYWKNDIVFGPLFNLADGYGQRADVAVHNIDLQDYDANGTIDWANMENTDTTIYYKADLVPTWGSGSWVYEYESGTAASGCIPYNLVD